MEDPGENLKRERERRGVTLKQMHEATKVQTKHLEALEADDYSSLPHPAFVRGFIKSYCKVLGLDDTDALLRYEMYLRENAPPSGVKDSAAVREGEIWQEPINRLRERLPGKATRNIAVLVAAGVAIMVIFYLFSGRHKKVSVQAEQDETAAVKTEDQKIAEPHEALPEPAPPAVKDGAGTGNGKTVPEAVKPPPDVDAKSHALTVRASERTWIRVRIDNDEPFDVMLQKGESIVWKAGRNLSVLVGNAGGVDMVFDGKKLQSLGKSGAVVSLVLPIEAAVEKGAVAPPR
ncbi:MAG: helix-turn-helix domain-containing protein [Deltaproteobacteria bacterium]|nr:helix-turn-helix domain-containing protein [Deltaproteobacteria bacterium]